MLAAERGIPTVFATGRPIRWLDPILALEGLHPLVIASNGAMLYDVDADEIRERSVIDPEVAAAVTAELREVIPQVVFGVEQGRRFGREAGYALPVGADEAAFTGPLEELLGAGEAVKLLVKHEAMSCEELAEAAASVVGDRLTITHSSDPGVGLLEVSAPGVSKASLLADYCGRLGIDATDVAAFGDQPNDLAMLAWAGHPHVMAESHPLLHRLGAASGGTNADSGVGRTLLRWLEA